MPTLVAAATCVAARRQRGVVRTFTLAFASIAALDAWLGGPWTPLPASGPLVTASVVTFVVLGDLRYFLATRLGALPVRSAFGRAAALAFVVPVVTQLVVRLPFPELPDRVLFLIYELCMLLVIGLDFARRPRDLVSRRLFGFEFVQYALWASADVLLLARIEAGWAVRIVANVLYYAAFVPFAAQALQIRFSAEAGKAE